MTVRIGPTFRLVPRGGAGLCCDDDGLALGPIALAVLHPGAGNGHRMRLRSRPEIAKALRLAYGEIDEPTILMRERGVTRVAELLAAGDSVRARMHAVLLAFPEIDATGMKKLASAGALLKFNPDWASEARVPPGEEGHGEWTRTGGDVEAAAAKPGNASAAKPKKKKETLEDIHAKKQRFVEEHLADAQKAADALHVPVENVLGISALESGWGVDSRFAIEGNNFFNLYYPAPFATGTIAAKQKTMRGTRSKLSRFASFADSARSFVRAAGPYVQGKADPVSFASAAQDSGKFGIDPDTGLKMEGFVSSLVSTIRGLRPYIARHGTGQ